MADLYANLKYHFVHGSFKFLFDSMSVDGGTQVSKYPVMTNGLSYAINGKVPYLLTLKGRFMRDDFDAIMEYINDNSGSVISGFNVDSIKFTSMVLTKGSAVLGKESFMGEITLVFEKAGES